MNIAKKITLVFLLGILFSCCKKSEEQKDPLLVKTIEAKKSRQKEFLDVFGTVTYKTKTEVTALVEGTIFELKALEGCNVKKGDVLLKMKNIQYEIQKVECQNEVNSAKARLRAAEQNLEESGRDALVRLASLENSKKSLSQKIEELLLAKKNLENNKLMLDAGGISESAFEKMRIDYLALKTEAEILQKEIDAQEMGFRDSDLLAAGIEPSLDKEEKKLQLVELNLKKAKIEIELSKTALENSEQNLKSINSLMENLTVRSPASGIIAELECENGERLIQNKKILTIINMEEPYARLSVQEKDIQKIASGSPALVEIESLGIRQQSDVGFISPLADYESGNFIVKIPLKNEEGNMRLGMFAQAQIECSGDRECYSLPKDCVASRNGNNVLIFCVKNNFLFLKECPVEKEDAAQIYIEKGIKDGDIIVAKATSELKEGVFVKTI